MARDRVYAKLLGIQEVLGEKGLIVPRAGRESLGAGQGTGFGSAIRAELAEADLPALEGRPDPSCSLPRSMRV